MHTITFIGASPLFDYLLGKTFSAEILPLQMFDPESSMHSIKTDEHQFLFDIKNTQIIDKPYIHGILQHNENVGRAVIELS